MLKKVYLKEEVVSYLKGELSQGRELAQRLLELDLEKGALFTYAPNGFDFSGFDDYSESMEFKVGEKVVQKFEEIALGAIDEYLVSNPRNIAIFETLWNVNDPIVSKRNHQFFLIHSAVYDFILGSDVKKPIKQYLRDAQSYPTVIALSTNLNGGDSLHNRHLDEDSIEIITNNTNSIIVGAFDGEGFLFWISEEKRNELQE